MTPDQRAAARIYLDYLLAEAQQRKAMSFGFRPADARIALAAPLDREHGIDPTQPMTTLEVPGADVMDAVIRTWRVHKKHSRVTLLLDISGSMNQEQRLPNAHAGAKQLLEMLANEDLFSLVTFSDEMIVRHGDVSLQAGRPAIQTSVDNLKADGGTRLYDSIADAYRQLLTQPKQDRINAIVVLTDGQDTGSERKIDQLLSELQSNVSESGIRVFTIGYGKGANPDVLKKIAEQTRAKFYEGTTQNIRTVLRDIATFF